MCERICTLPAKPSQHIFVVQSPGEHQHAEQQHVDGCAVEPRGVGVLPADTPLRTIRGTADAISSTDANGTRIVALCCGRG